MLKLIILAGLACFVWKSVMGRWPWEARREPRGEAVVRARQLLGVSTGASREDIIASHRRMVALVHPDRGGTPDLVHEATAARDLLLGELPPNSGV